MLRSSSWRRCEDVGGQLAREAGQHSLSLGAELGQLLCVFGGQGFSRGVREHGKIIGFPGPIPSDKMATP
jgi:hypothetical protein